MDSASELNKRFETIIIEMLKKYNKGPHFFAFDASL